MNPILVIGVMGTFYKISLVIRFSINVWCGFTGLEILGSVSCHCVLTGERYLEFLTKILEDFPDDLKLADHQGIFFIELAYFHTILKMFILY